MSNRKSAPTGMSGDATANPNENYNALYTAHQVHTLANLLFRQLSGGFNSATPWAATGIQAPQSYAAGPGYGTVQGNPMPAGPMAPFFTGGPSMSMPPPALFYWYP